MDHIWRVSEGDMWKFILAGTAAIAIASTAQETNRPDGGQQCRLFEDKQSIALPFGGAVEAFPAICQLIL